MIQGNIARFEKFSSAIKEDEELGERWKTSITQHLQSVKIEFKGYFPEFREQKAVFMQNQFSTALNVNDVFIE